MHERYVAPIERGDMRGAGRAGGYILVTVAEGVTTKKILGPTAGFRPNRGVSKSSHNGGAGKSGSWKSSGKSGSKPGGTGGKFVHQSMKVDRSLKMRNMSEFFSDAPLGRMLRGSAERTGKTYQSVPIYRMSKKMEIGDVKLNKGDHFYLDKLHGDHIEVFSKKGKLRDVLDLGGNTWERKLRRAEDEGRNIKDLVSHVETSHALA